MKTMKFAWPVILAGMAIAVIAVTGPAGARGGEGLEFRAGAYKVDITPDPESGEFWLGGYAPARRALSVRDPLFARCLAVESGGTGLILAAVDSVGMLVTDIEPYRRAMQAATGVPEDRIFIFATHSHSTLDQFGLYGGVPGEFLDAMPDFMARCAVGAREDLRPARLRFASIEAPDLNGNRRHESREPADPEAAALRFETPDGEVIATAANYACHPVTFPREDTAMGADYMGALNRRLEREGGVGLFFLGAAGDLNPSYSAIAHRIDGDDPYAKGDALGLELAERLLAALEDAPDAESPHVDSSTVRFAVRVENPPFRFLLMSGRIRINIRGGSIPAEIGVIEIGPARIVSIPGELFSEIGTELKRRLGGELNMVFTFGNGYIGYMPSRADWTDDGYEESLAVSPRIEEIIYEQFELARGR